mmetsp:Transcript_30627/g.66849  ORF Transcript_30627/g.66849 Transcript_30627/m.66849 type:complete len:121 (+) Transcript_30627:469-831(+)
MRSCQKQIRSCPWRQSLSWFEEVSHFLSKHQAMAVHKRCCQHHVLCRPGSQGLPCFEMFPHFLRKHQNMARCRPQSRPFFEGVPHFLCKHKARSLVREKSMERRCHSALMLRESCNARLL